MSEYLFGRRVRVTIYKQGLTSEELQQALSEGGDPEGQTSKTEEEELNDSEKGSGILAFDIDETLPLEFEITKTLDNSGKSNHGTLRIHGISEGTARAMGYQMLTCKIAVGYRGQPITPIFLGDIISASYKRGKKGESSYADFQLSQSYLKMNAGVKFSRNFPRDTTLADVFAGIIEEFDTPIRFLTADADTKEVLEKKLPYGLSLDGTLNECLQKILKPYGFKWHIDNFNVIEIFQDDVYSNTEGRSGTIVKGQLKLEDAPQGESNTVTSSGIPIYELSADSGLVEQPYLETESITKRLAEYKIDVPVKGSKTGKTRKKTIKPKIKVARQVVNFKTLLLPDLDVKTAVRIVSQRSEELTGLYGILSIKYKGETFGNNWYCECVGISTEKES